MAKNFTRSFDLESLALGVEQNAKKFDKERDYIHYVISTEFEENDWVSSFIRGSVRLWVNCNMPDREHYLQIVKSVCRELHLDLEIKKAA